MENIVKKLLIAAAVATPIFFMSYSPKEPAEATLSEKAPDITLISGKLKKSLKDFRGKKVLLHFWSKSDPESRIDNHRNYLKSARRDDIVYLAVCTDSADEKLSRTISESDGNDRGTQYYLSQVDASTNLKAYTSSGSGTWLISPEGVIIANHID